MAIKVCLKTNKGDINLNLFADIAPITVASFVNLIQRKYYDGLIFHRVISDFMIQGGCPQGSGTGGPGYKFQDECSKSAPHDKPGKLSMANAGPKTNGSQFFITHGPTPHLNGKHTVFGEVCSDKDMAVVNLIAQRDQIISATVSGDTQELLTAQADNVKEWNSVLDKNFKHLAKAK